MEEYEKEGNDGREQGAWRCYDKNGNDGKHGKNAKRLGGMGRKMIIGIHFLGDGVGWLAGYGSVSGGIL